MKRITERLRSRNGMTLMELLCAVLIFALLAGTIVTGVGVGAKVRRQNAFSAASRDCETLLRLSLEDLLHYAEPLPGNEDSFSCPGREIEAGRLVLSGGALYCLDDADGEAVPLLSPGLFPELAVSSFDFHFEEGVYLGEFVLISGRDMRRCTFAVRPVYR